MVQEGETMKEEHIDLEKLEPVQFEIDKGAFQPKTAHCSQCRMKMKKTELETEVDKNIYLRLAGFECPKCRKRYLGLEEAQKMDKALILSRAFHKDFKMERSLSFDGDNYTFRIPKEFTKQVHKRKIEIVPLGAKEFCATVE